MPRAPLLHALVLVILAIGASDAKRLSAPTSSNGTASNETASNQPASNETALKQPASNETLNQTRLASSTDDGHWTDNGHWTYRTKGMKTSDICAEVEEDPCRSKCTCQYLERDTYFCKYNTTRCGEAGPPCYNGRKKAGDCCKSCPNGPNCLVWGRVLQPGDIWQNPGKKSEYAFCAKTGFRITEIKEFNENGFPIKSKDKYPPGPKYPCEWEGCE